MDKKSKIMKAINKEHLESVPFSFWTHLPGVDLNPKLLAIETYNFYKKYDIDFIKTMNNGMYAIEDFGCEIDYSEIENGGIAKLVNSPIKVPSDWEKINICNINKGAFARELESVKLLKQMVGDEAPIIFTIFSPITIAAKLSNNLIFNHIKDGYGEIIHKALRNITETNKLLIEALNDLNIDGIFFAAQTLSYNYTDIDTYLEYGKKYDLEVLKKAQCMWFNVLHAHGENLMFSILRDYPVDVFNWHAWETLPDLNEGKISTDKCIMTGIARFDITNSNYWNISNQIFKSISSTNGLGIILTPGCVIRYPINEKVLKFIQNEVVFWSNKIIKNNFI